MTQETRQRASDALFRCRTYGGKYFPEIYVVGKHIAFFRNQAKRLLERLQRSYHQEYEMETLSFKMAYFTRNGKYPTDKEEREDVDWHVCQAGELFDGKLYNPLQPNYNGNSFKPVRKHARADSGRCRPVAQAH